MVHGNALNSYQKAQVYDEMDPHKLILLLYNDVIKRVVLAREGLRENNPQKRGENLGKAIAIISELNSCLDEKNQTEEISFLRGLYAAMLTELPKVSVSGDIQILDRTEKYITELRRIWVENVMNNSGNRPDLNKAQGYNTEMKSYQGSSIAL